jgi:hypothetical protein
MRAVLTASARAARKEAVMSFVMAVALMVAGRLVAVVFMMGS